ncbi:hypothetical protein [Enterobacter wuhouensis]|uniref:hypothetical protein n=1 Tax=Enterobacter wuhouensis TaxID=2529381 RepID=UPI003D7717FC
MKIKSALIAMMLLSGVAHAAGCETVEEMDTADTAVSKIHGWTDVHSFYIHLRQCDDGSISEGISATVVSLLTHQWKTSVQLEKIADKDKTFETWVLNHIDTTVDAGDLETIVKNATGKCPEGGGKFCEKIEGAANQALLDMKNTIP